MEAEVEAEAVEAALKSTASTSLVTTPQYYTKLQKNPLIYDFSLRIDLKALCTKEYFSIFSTKFLCTRYPRVPQYTTLRAKKPQIIYFWLKFFGLELKD